MFNKVFNKIFKKMSDKTNKTNDTGRKNKLKKLDFSKIKSFLRDKSDSVLRSLLPEIAEDPLTIDAFNALMSRYVMADFLTYGNADDEFDCIWLDDDPKGPNSVLLGYELQPLIFAGNKATQKLEKMIKRMPVGTVITSIAHISDDILSYLENWSMARRNTQEPIFDLITRRRCRHLIDWTSGLIKPMSRGSSFKPRILHHYLFVRIPADFKRYTREAVEGYLDHVEKLHDIIDSQMKAAHLYTRRLTGSELSIVIKNIANPHLSAADNREVGINSKQTLNSQIVTPNTQVALTKNGDLHFRDSETKQEKYVRVLSANKYQSNNPHYIGDMQNCIGSIVEADDFIPGEFYHLVASF